MESSSSSRLEPLALEARDVQCVRGFTTLFEGVNFSLENGTAMHLHGTNGCGKTSLLRILSGLGIPECGIIFCNGEPISKDRSYYLNRLCYHGHQLGLKSELNGYENLAATLAMGNAQDPRLRSGDYIAEAAIQESLQVLEIDHAAHLPCGQLSAGQKQRIALARLLLSHAPLWILDEPGTALDTSGLTLLEGILSNHVKAGGVVIFTSHHEFSLEGIQQQRLALDQFSPVDF